RVWNSVEKNSTPSQANKAAREFGDELVEEYGKTKEEWAKIDKSIVEWIAGGTGVSTVLSPLITGGMDWKIPAMGFAITGIDKLLSSRYKRRNFKANVPLAVFLDLEKKEKFLK
ncbi:unnamed protein product, partial [marine sediment metagenome]